MIPFKLWKLGLDPYEFAVFATLRMHGDKDGRDIFPTLKTIMAETGISRDRVWKSLRGLRELGVIEWESGNSSKANDYRIAPIGVWKSRNSPPRGPSEGSATRTTTVRFSGGKGPPHGPQLDPGTRSMNYSAPAVEEETATPEVAAHYAAIIRNTLGIRIPERPE